MLRKSRITAPVGEVTMPTVRGKRQRTLAAGSKSLRLEFSFELFEGELQRTGADRVIVSATNCIWPRCS